ncbi:NAD(P)H-dependent oxidoreductase [Hyphomicrobium sp.]|uniref:NADPH-dependent FMN reductase n=1 Tax=Hyphomicrobium sp. TaxID=82 RepID=UPI0025BE30DD|nr:NAD(P)H-dependent oxidoreductase [Hyphomicrobium sp.]MCC7251215.1 NAD(P)H-dependent oxidoreductase [Hyphomicrobium sp.]
MTSRPHIAIVVSTTRQGRFGDTPTAWIADIASRRGDATFEVVDLRDYPMPFFEQKIPLIYAPVENDVARQWAAKMASFDGYIFVTAEYNHSITGVLKNALDHLYEEPQRKPATFVGYGGTGAARAIEHLRNILAELHVATLKHAVHIGMVEMIGMLREGKQMTDYPHLEQSAVPMLDDLVWWTVALKQAREAATR